MATSNVLLSISKKLHEDNDFFQVLLLYFIQEGKIIYEGSLDPLDLRKTDLKEKIMKKN